MDFKEAYIDKMICHHFSFDRQNRVVNRHEIDMSKLDQDSLKEFFVKPFSKEKNEYTFIHTIDLKYNVVYNTVIDVYYGGDFVENSISLFKHLDNVSTAPTIKDGDIFIIKVADIIIGDTYCDAVGIFKIETKKEFIETYIDPQGNLNISVKSGYVPQKIDKACLIVFTDNAPIGLIIDKSKDSKFWRQDFLGMETKTTPYSQSKTLMDLMEGFVKDKLSKNSMVTKSEQIEIVNKYADVISKSDTVNILNLESEVFHNQEIFDMFEEYRKIYEEREGFKLTDKFAIDKNALNVSKKIRKIKLDDTVELYLMKTGTFIERGYDDDRGQNFYKLYFDKEK